jgi:hypothetical protein
MLSQQRRMRKFRKRKPKRRRGHSWILLLTFCIFLCILLIPYYYSATNHDLVLSLEENFDWQRGGKEKERLYNFVSNHDKEDWNYNQLISDTSSNDGGEALISTTRTNGGGDDGDEGGSRNPFDHDHHGSTSQQSHTYNEDKKKNKIQLENELPGSPEWTLSKPAIGREVEGYMSKTSVNRGENISLFYNVNPLNLNTTTEKLEESAANVTIEVFRTGWYGGIGARKVLGPVQVPGIFQTIPTSQEDGLIVCNWKNPYVVETKPSWTTGVYLVKMTEMYTFAQSYAIFV